MSRIVIPFLLFLLLVLEGVALDLLPFSLVESDVQLVPHWVLVFLILKIIFFDREDTYASVIHGFIFGFLIDVVYTGVLGVYMFSYALVVYLIHGLAKVLHANFLPLCYSALQVWHLLMCLSILYFLLPAYQKWCGAII